MVDQDKERRDYAAYALPHVKELANSGKVNYVSWHIEQDVNNLGYSAGDVHQCIANLETSHFQHSERPIGRKRWQDVYHCRWLVKSGCADDSLCETDADAIHAYRGTVLFPSPPVISMSEKLDLCPICEEGRLTPATHELCIKHGGASLTVPRLEHSACDLCGEEPVLAAQVRRNQCRIADAKRMSDGMLTSRDVRQVRDHLGINQHQAALLFGGGANAFSKYERGDVVQSVAMDRLLKAAVCVPGLFEFLQSEAGLLPVSAIVYQGGKTIEMSNEDFSSHTVGDQAVRVSRSDWSSRAELA